MVKHRDARHTTKAFAAGAFPFVVETGDDDDRALVEAMFSDLPTPDPGAKLARFALVRERPDAWTVRGPRSGAPPLPLGDALKQLLTAVNLCALDAEPEFLHLHAAAAAKEGRVVVMFAPRDTGKTTTVAHLLERGWGFVTDETVRISPDGLEITGLPKPLSVKPGSQRMLAQFDRWMIPTSDADEEYRFVPVGTTGVPVVARGTPSLFVLLQRVPESSALPPLQWLHPVDAVVTLMQETMDAERFGAAVPALARLVARAHCVALRMGTPAQTVDEIEALSRRVPPPSLEVTVLPASPACTPGVTTVRIGDRVVVHNTRTGQIFALDEGGARIWQALGGWSADDGIDVDAPIISPLVSQIRSFGVLRDAR